jgi:O-antigen/teichoic acid export membrane protein
LAGTQGRVLKRYRRFQAADCQSYKRNIGDTSDSRFIPLSIRQNVAANYLGQGCRAITGLAFIPLYVKYLGIEAYGLIGIFAILQSSMALLDLGMKPALGREMARFTAGAHDSQSIRDLLRSIEIVGFGVAIAIATGVWGASGWLASDWLTTKTLSNDVVAQAFVAMGALIALRFIENIYTSSIVGLQRQVLESTVSCGMAIARGLGSVAVLAWISPTLKAFFLWQSLISLVTVPVLASIVYRTLPSCSRRAQFSSAALNAIWRFAGGIMAISLLALSLTQVDKILLSRLLPLKNFAYYALAGTLTSVLYMLSGPVNAAFYPQFTELTTRGDSSALHRAYHLAAQLATVVMGSAAIVLIMFADVILHIWTGNHELAANVSHLLQVLALGTLLNGLMGIPYQMQLAHGWTGLTIKINTAAVAIMVPAVIYVTPRYGAIGAAWIWVALNVGYLMIDIYFMHRRLLQTEKGRWYGQDVALPLAAATVATALFRWCWPEGMNKIEEVCALVGASGCVMITTAFVCPLVRIHIKANVLASIRHIRTRV